MQQNLVDFLTAGEHAGEHAGDRLVDTVCVLCARKAFYVQVYEHQCTELAGPIRKEMPEV